MDLVEQVKIAHIESQEELVDLLVQQQELLRQGNLDAARELNEKILETRKRTNEVCRELSEKLRKQVSRKLEERNRQVQSLRLRQTIRPEDLVQRRVQVQRQAPVIRQWSVMNPRFFKQQPSLRLKIRVAPPLGLRFR
ncbi:MAG: hypothetical protein PHV61_10800 [Limnochordia bacterium]|nr:hypothetical protein [Limnochordia bacterium]